MSRLKLVDDGKLFFLHIPKTAETSLVGLLESQFEESEICRAYADFELKPIPQAQFEKYRLYWGHITLDVLNRYLPEKPQVITLLRHPVDLTISLYGQLRRDANTDQEEYNRRVRSLTLDEYVYNTWIILNRDFRNFQVERLIRRLHFSPAQVALNGGTPDVPYWTLDNQTKLAIAIDLLKGFKFVGIAERLTDSLALLAYTMGWRPFEATPFLNVGFSKEQRAGHKTDPDLYDEIVQNSPLDMELYELARKLFEERYDRMIQDLLGKYGTAAQAHVQLPLPPEEVQSLLDQHYRQKFAERNPAFRTYHYDMGQPLTGKGWHERNLNADHGLHRWSGPETHSTLDFPLASDKGDLKIRFRVLATLAPDILASLRLDVAGQDIPLTGKVNPDTSTDFEGILPSELIRQQGGVTRLSFRVSRTVKPSEVYPDSPDQRCLGINLNWVEFSPVNQSEVIV